MPLEVTPLPPSPNPPLEALFEATFTASDGPVEGTMIGKLVRTLLAHTSPEDLYVFAVHDAGRPIAGAVFSRLRYSDDPRTVFILSPMAVVPDRQSQGVGQMLLRRALDQLRSAGVDAALTYGAPSYYGQVGFAPMPQDQAAPPLPLSQPIGWIGQSLTSSPLLPLRGSCVCVDALNDPNIW
ncbi:MAG: GNAT family N-acetyltransferase [Pseudomonadota bacterium]